MNDYKLHQGDCLDIMSTFKDKEFDLCLTDPPYGIIQDLESYQDWGVAKQLDYEKVEWDETPLSSEQLQEIIRVSENQIIFGGNHFHTILPQSRGWYIWDKRVGIPSNNFSDAELIWSSFNRQVRTFHHKWVGFIRDSEKGRERVHPTQKPVKLMEWLLDSVKDIKTVVDPFIGSGTTMFACQNRRLDCTGIEISPHYCDIVEKRCFTRTFLDRKVSYNSCR